MKRHTCYPPIKTGSASFAGFRYPAEVILLAVRWYLRFGLSYRDLEELLAERGIEVDHVTLYRWVQRFTPLIVDAARPCRHAVGDRWFVDETYVKVAGNWRYVYRAVDQYGQVIDMCISEKRDVQAATRFFSTAINAHGEPAEVTTVGTALVLHADDAPGARGEIDPRIEALAPVAAHHDGGSRRILDVDPTAEAVAGDLGDADRVVTAGVVAGDLVGDELVHSLWREHADPAGHPVVQDHGEKLAVAVDRHLCAGGGVGPTGRLARSGRPCPKGRSGVAAPRLAKSATPSSSMSRPTTRNGELPYEKAVPARNWRREAASGCTKDPNDEPPPWQRSSRTPEVWPMSCRAVIA